jgi:hypothetical protein
MVAAVACVPDRRIVAVHRTFLSAAGCGKAKVPNPKCSLGPVGGGAVRLAPAGPKLVVAEGIEKSACDQEALWPIRSRENALRTVYEADLPRYLDDQATWDQEGSQILRSKGVTREEKQDALATLGLAPQKPLLPILTCPEPTYEGLCHLLREAQPSIGLFSAEGGSFIGGHACPPTRSCAPPRASPACGMATPFAGCVPPTASVSCPAGASPCT